MRLTAIAIEESWRGLSRRFCHLNLVSISLGRHPCPGNYAYNPLRAAALQNRYCDAMDSTYTYAHRPNGYSRRVAVKDQSSRLEWDTTRNAKERDCAISPSSEFVVLCQ